MDPLTRSLTPRHQTVATTFGTVHYWEYNPDAPQTIVAIHGYRGTHLGLERIVASLPSVRFIIPDLPGFGRSAPYEAGQHTIEQYATSVAELMEQLGLVGSVVLGHSMGSIVAAELAKQHPTYLQALILVNPIAADPLKGVSALMTRPAIAYQWLGGKALPPVLGRRLLDSKLFLLIGSIFMAKTTDPALRQLIHYNHTTYMKEYASPAMLYEAYLGSISSTVRDRAEHLTMPTLLIAGANDDLAPLRAQHELHALLPEAQLAIVDEVGHLIHYEKPAEAAEAITQFLTRLPVRK